MSTMIVDNFTSGLDDLTRKQQRDIAIVLKVLEKHKRFSVFEATANDVIARTMDEVYKGKYVRDTGGAFPWRNVELTDAGRALIGATHEAGALGDKGEEEQKGGEA